MVLDAALLNTQHYKVRIKSNVEQSRERSIALHLGIVAIEKGDFGSSSSTVTNFTFTYIYLSSREFSMAQWLKCWIAAPKSVSSNTSCTITFTFWLIPLEKVWTPYSPSYGLNSITAVLLLRWFWHEITHEGWYAIKQRNQPTYLSSFPSIYL